MSQFSQFSEASPSSTFSSDITDYTDYSLGLPLNNQLVSPNLSCNQRIVTSTPDADFLGLTAIPSSLERVGPGKQKGWVLFSAMNKTDFVAWWVLTQYASVPEQRNKIRWDATHLSDAWKNFDQVAHYISGEPRVMCQRCGKTLPHPHHTSNGTNSMKRHFSGEKCQQAGAQSKQKNIQQSLFEAVSMLYNYIISSKLKLN